METLRVTEEEWDFLIVLDACRYDFFAERFPSAEKRWSIATATSDWLERSFPGWYDLVYVSGNPFCGKKKWSETHRTIRGLETFEFCGLSHFKEIIEVWKDDWCQENETAMPEVVAKSAIGNLYKKMVIHFMQPHEPYVGLKERTGSREYERAIMSGASYEEAKGILERNGIEDETLPKTASEIYRMNLDYVILNGLIPLVEVLERTGKIVVTSDHGEGLGDDGIWGHQPNYRDSQFACLREVPWLIVS